MANVFVSYARDDRARIQPLVGALEAEGLSVWWDPALIPGRRFRQMIAHELSTADAVLVIWTRQALESDWVQDEAEEARQRGVLIPIIMEPVTPPAGFRQLQAADLSQWTGQSAHPEFKALIHACKALAQWAEQERAAKTAAPAAAPPSQTEALVASPDTVEPPLESKPPTAPELSPEALAARPQSEPARPASPPEPPIEWLRPAQAGSRAAGAALALVRGFSPVWVGWAISIGLLLLLTLSPNQKTGFEIPFTAGSALGVVCGLISRVISRRGYPPVAVNAAFGGLVVGAVAPLLIRLAVGPQDIEMVIRYELSIYFFAEVLSILGGYAVFGASPC